MEFKEDYNAIILPEITPLSMEFGGMTTVEDVILFEYGNISDYLPKNVEVQSNVYFDDFGCTSNSFQNGLKVLCKKQLSTFSKKLQKLLTEKYTKNGEIDFSNRDLIVLSGTKPRIGNSGEKVLKTAQEKGLIPQTMGDWDNKSRDTKYTEENFYLYGRTKEAQLLAEELNKYLRITGEWTGRENWEEASKRGVLQIYVKAWYKNKEGKYYNPDGRYNHATLMADYPNKKLLDSYEPEIKQLVSWEDAYYLALKININDKTMEKPKLVNNTKIIVVTGPGNIGMYLDGKIIVDDLAKLNDVWMARNSKNGFFSGGPIKTLTQEQWDLFEKRNLKMEPIN